MKTKSIIAFIISISILCSFSSALATNENNAMSESVIDEIMDTYFSEKGILTKNLIASNLTTNNISSPNTIIEEAEYYSKVDDLRDERDSALVAAGFSPYRINSYNFNQMEESLESDLSEIGLDPSNEYLIVIGNIWGDESPIASPASAIGNTFTYTYNGTTLTMRHMTIYKDDNEASNFYQTTSASLVNSKTEAVVLNALNSALSLYIGAVSNSLGILYSLLGINISNVGYAGTSSLTLLADAEWTRTYTQVWSSYDNAWKFGACVEKVTTEHYISGFYWDSSLSSKVNVNTSPVSKTTFSSNYGNTTWMRSNAAANYWYSNPCSFDLTGNVYFKLGGVNYITFYEPPIYP